MQRINQWLLLLERQRSTYISSCRKPQQPFIKLTTFGKTKKNGRFLNDRSFIFQRFFDCSNQTLVFTCVLIVLNDVPNELPKADALAITAIAISDAIRPYSMAVAPDSSFTKDCTNVFISEHLPWLVNRYKSEILIQFNRYFLKL